MEAHAEELGPIGIVAIGYPAGAPMTGEAAPILVQLAESAGSSASSTPCS